MAGDQFLDGGFLTRVAAAAARDAQVFFLMLDAADAELGISFHNGMASPLALTIHRWLPPHDAQGAAGSKRRRLAALLQFRPPTPREIDAIRERLAAELAELTRLWRFSLGCHQFAPDFAHTSLTAREGILRDLVVGRRFFLDELPGLGGFAAALRAAAGLSSPKRQPD